MPLGNCYSDPNYPRPYRPAAHPWSIWADVLVWYLVGLCRWGNCYSDPNYLTFVWQILAAQNQRIMKEGEALQDPADNIAELERQAAEFENKNLPVLKALGIA